MGYRGSWCLENFYNYTSCHTKMSCCLSCCRVSLQLTYSSTFFLSGNNADIPDIFIYSLGPLDYSEYEPPVVWLSKEALNYRQIADISMLLTQLASENLHHPPCPHASNYITKFWTMHKEPSTLLLYYYYLAFLEISTSI